MKFTTRPSDEVTALRERFIVMTNLLRDIAENERYLSSVPLGEPDNITKRLMADCIARRRELSAEIKFVLSDNKSLGVTPRTD